MSVCGASQPIRASVSSTAGRSPPDRGRTSITLRPARSFNSSGVPAMMTRPWSMITTCRASWSASSRYWVVSSTSVPSATRFRIALPQIHAAAGIEPGGRLVEQQELRSADQAGAEVEAAAHATRVGAHEAVAGVAEIQSFEHLGGGSAASRRLSPNSRATMRRFSVPVIAGSTEAYCPARPMISRTRLGWAQASMPATRISPPSGRSNVATALTNVVLPAPFGPRSAVTWPDSATRSRPSRASTSPKRFVTPLASMIGVMGFLPRTGTGRPTPRGRIRRVERDDRSPSFFYPGPASHNDRPRRPSRTRPHASEP